MYICTILGVLWKQRLYVIFSKSKFLFSPVEFLGYVVFKKSVTVDLKRFRRL